MNDSLKGIQCPRCKVPCRAGGALRTLYYWCQCGFNKTNHEIEVDVLEIPFPATLDYIKQEIGRLWPEFPLCETTWLVREECAAAEARIQVRTIDVRATWGDRVTVAWGAPVWFIDAEGKKTKL